jgi:hypothetical protein
MVLLRQDIRSMWFKIMMSFVKELQSFPGLGIYSGIFAIYLQCPQNKSRTAYIIFCAICVLYFLSTVNAVIDLVIITFEAQVSNNPICRNIIFLKFGCAELEH